MAIIIQQLYLLTDTSIKFSNKRGALLASERVHIISAEKSVGAFLLMAQYFAALLVLCLSVGSLGTTTKPQQQNASASKDLCEVSTKLYYLVCSLYIVRS